jgi:hypothetical protein
MSDPISITDLRRQMAELQKVANDVRQNLSVAGGGSGPYLPTMNDERLGRLEGEIGGLKHSQNMLLGSIGLVGALVAVVAAFVIGFGVYTLQRVDAVNDKVNALPGQISSELRDLTKTLADVIIATKQMQPPPIPPQQSPSPPQSGR